MIVPPTPRWTPLRPHLDQLRLWHCDRRFALIEAGRRSGKTERAKRRGSRAAWQNVLYADFRVAFCAPTRDQARAIYWDDLKALQPRELVASISETRLEIVLVNGSTVSVVGMDKPERIEGPPLDWAFLDEFSSMRQGVWGRNILPALSTDGRPGRAWIYGVPRPSAEAKELAVLARKDPDWAYFNWASSTVVSKEILDQARQTMDPLTFAQEFEAKRVSLSGRAYYAMDRDVHVRQGVRAFYNPAAPLLVGLDFNVCPGVAAIGQEVMHPELGLIDAWIGEVWIPKNSNTPAVCRRIAQDWGSHVGPVHLDGDATGGARRTSGEATDWQLVDQVLRPVFRGGLFSFVPRANPLERDRTNAMNSRLRSTDGKIHTLIDADWCPRLATDLDDMQLLQGGSGELDKKMDPSLSHISDSAAYSVVRRYPLNQVVSAWEPA